MPRPAKEVTDAELAVLEELWQRGPQTVRELTDRLYPGGSASESATVQKLCERLLAKKCVARRGRKRPVSYAAKIDREDLIGRHLKQVADRLCAGSLTPLLTHLVDAASFDADVLDELRAQVDRLDAERRSQRERELS